MRVGMAEGSHLLLYLMEKFLVRTKVALHKALCDLCAFCFVRAFVRRACAQSLSAGLVCRACAQCLCARLVRRACM